MSMQCEFCDVTCDDVKEARSHMLTIDHVRNKRQYELSMIKFNERERQRGIHPKDFFEMCKLLNMHSAVDVRALHETNFFRCATRNETRIDNELIRILNENNVEFHTRQLPAPLRDRLNKLIDKRNAEGKKWD